MSNVCQDLKVITHIFLEPALQSNCSITERDSRKGVHLDQRDKTRTPIGPSVSEQFCQRCDVTLTGCTLIPMYTQVQCTARAVLSEGMTSL